MEMERQQPSRTPEGNRPRDKDHGTRSMGQILSREDQPQEGRRRTISFSSEEPYRRFFGMEILDHGENAVASVAAPFGSTTWASSPAPISMIMPGPSFLPE